MLFLKRDNVKKIYFILLILFSYQSISLAAGQQNNAATSTPFDPERPKIGLVLSGGGARGFAHIGVLKILEQNNVPIDYIVGTSMGSIIGGLYAIGLSPAEIEEGIKGIAWDKVFDDFAYREYKTFRRKQDDFDFFSIHRIGINDDGLQLSPGLIEGQQIELALDRLAHPAFHIHDYDKLSIPFRAVATNLENGKPFIIKNGNLARAMRASMSIPGALPPITIDNTLLVDGGIANNIPIDIAREMGAEIIIAIDVSAPLSKKEELKSTVDVTGQLTTILTRRIADLQIKTLTENDVLIIPGALEVSSSDFEQYETLIKAGEDAALVNLENIKKLSLPQQQYSKHTASLPSVARIDPVISFIEINNKTGLRDEVIRVRIHQKIGKPLDIKQLEEDLSYIYGLDYSSSVVYSLETRGDKTGLIIYARGRNWAHSYLQFGLSIKSESEVGAFTNFDAAYTKQDLNDLAGEFRATVGLGSEPEISAEIYQPLNIDLDFFVAAKIGINTNIFPNVINNNVDSIERFHRTFIDISTGKVIKQTTRLKLGLRHNEGRTVTISGNSLLSNGDFREGFFYASLFHDSLDNLSFPNSGLFGDLIFRLNKESLGADNDYEQLEFLLSGAGTYRRYTIFSRMMLKTTLDENAPFNAAFRNGGFLELSGTLEQALVGQHFGLIEAAFYRRLGDISFFPMYAGFSIEAGNAWNRHEEINSNNTILAGSLFIGADTFIGPLYLAFGFTNSGEQALYFNLGQTFLIR
ncbi:MAG: patatin-like phospholipase family protein [Gammaproteobacteria bacterium]|nr:patatin-like phospholipase family protein [Gammaproteobacteria bacterium]